MNNRLEAYDFTLESKGSDGVRVRLSTEDEPYFLIENEEPLIYIGNDEFYLQSNNYGSSSGMKINLDEGNILAHKFTLSTDKLRLSTSDPYFWIKGGSSKKLIHIGEEEYYLQSSNYISNSSGMHIDLSNGKIDAYNFTLTASGSGGNILIDSDGSIPLKIGEKFQVSWDGVMTSDGATIRTATIEKATINNATINSGTLNSATLTGEIKGHSGAWSINQFGVASFSNGTIGCFDFNDTVLSSNTSNASLVFGNSRIRAYSGDTGLALSGSRIYLQGENGTSISNGLYLASGGITAQGKLQLPAPQNVTFGGTSLDDLLEITFENGRSIGYEQGWSAYEAQHECPEPDSGGSGESSEPSGPSNNT